jgi:AcrR family transcriptional regulator
MTNKEHILHTALALFAQKGYDATPTKLIASEAGVSEGLIFRHYGNKTSLLAAIIQMGFGQIAATMQSYKLEQDPRQAIEAHIKQSFSLLLEHENFWRLVQKVRNQSIVREVAGQQILEVTQFIVEQLTGNFRRMGVADPESEALVLFAIIDGVTLHYLESPQTYPLNEIQSLLITKYSQYGAFMG